MVMPKILPPHDIEKMSNPFKRAPKGILSDPDKDGFPNAVDCSDHNKNKQGAISWVVAKATGRTHDEVDEARKAAKELNPEDYTGRASKPVEKKGFLQFYGDKFKQWKANAPQRRKEQKERLKEELQIHELRTKIASKRIGLQKERLDLQKKNVEIMKQKQKMFDGLPTLMGGFSTKKASFNYRKPKLMLKKKKKRR